MDFLKQTIKQFIPEKFRPKVKALFYYGNKKQCPCCNGHLRKFLPMFSRSSAICPICGSLERHRRMCLYLENKTKIFSERTLLLHFAPEDVFIDKFSSSSNIFYVNADIKSKKAMIHMDITNIPHKDDTFDIILCIHVLEHVEDDRKALRELFRVLKHQGQAILLNPVDRKRDKTFEDPKIVKPEDRKRMFGQEDHVRVYGKDFIYRLIEAGFRVEIEDYTIRFNNHMIEKHGLSRDDLIFLCVKN